MTLLRHRPYYAAALRRILGLSDYQRPNLVTTPKAATTGIQDAHVCTDVPAASRVRQAQIPLRFGELWVYWYSYKFRFHGPSPH
jgi:hypothetical protein